MKTNYYVDNKEFVVELQRWRDSAKEPSKRIPSERLGEILITLHDHILQHRNFARYRQDLKDEMKSYSLFRILKRGLFTYDFGKSTPFAYFTRAAFSNFYAVLSRYYKRLNNHQEYIKGELMKLDTHGDMNLEQLLRDFGISE